MLCSWQHCKIIILHPQDFASTLYKILYDWAMVLLHWIIVLQFVTKNSHIIYPYSQSWYFFQFFIANIFLHCKKAGPESKPSQSLLTWEAIHRKMPWSLVLLLGGGFALAKASTVSGLSAMMGHQLETLGKFWLYVKELERSKVIWNKENSKYLMQCMIVGKPTKIPKEVQKGLLNPELYKVQSIDDGRFLFSNFKI